MSPLPVDLGEGAILRRLRMDDLEPLWEAVEAERERLDPWMAWIAETRTIDDEREWLEGVVADEGALEGFRREGVARGAGRGTHGHYDLLVYGLLQDEWLPP